MCNLATPRAPSHADPGREDPSRLEATLLRLIGPVRGGLAHRVRALLASEELAPLSRRAPRELQATHGLTPTQARRLASAFELGRAVERARARNDSVLSNAEAVHQLLAPELRGLEKETFHALLLDTRHRLLSRVRVSEGTLTTSLVHPREVFGPALRWAAAAVIVAHNHPSGDPTPSAEDESVTRRLIQAGGILGVPLVDHVVLGQGCWVSLRERIDFGTPRGR